MIFEPINIGTLLLYDVVGTIKNKPSIDTCSVPIPLTFIKAARGLKHLTTSYTRAHCLIKLLTICQYFKLINLPDLCNITGTWPQKDHAVFYGILKQFYNVFQSDLLITNVELGWHQSSTGNCPRSTVKATFESMRA